MQVIAVTAGSAALESVLLLWRAQSDTLGFMPRGGFDDAARAGGIVAVEATDGSLAGYVMFRQTAQRNGSITHLCVDPAHRGKGVARKLFEAVKSACAECYEIRLRCRRDFAASALWPRLGFVAVADERGRGREGIITSWRYEVATLPLFRTLSGAVPSSSAVRAVIDANVFFDLDDQGDGHDESRGLSADWLTEFVELAVTPELFNEINRREDAAHRQRQRARADRFPCVARDTSREEAILSRVAGLLPPDDSASSRSDARQIAMAIAGNVTFFVTRDGGVLAAADSLEETFGLQVASPHEIIRRFDELRREELYRPRRLFYGPGVTSSLARAEDIERMADLMHIGHAAGEPRRRTLGRLREMLASPDRHQATRIERDGQCIAAYVLDRTTPERLAVPFFAVAPTALGRTAARHYGETFVGLAAEEGRHLVHFGDVDPRVEEALSELGFSHEADGWMKLSLGKTVTGEQLAAELDRIAAITPSASQLARRVAGELRTVTSAPGLARTRSTMVAVEQALWPAKVTSAGVACYIVPIQPRWAKELFDRELAQTTLFGADPRLALSPENVYYRAPRPAILTAPARVLWYVSDDAKFPESKALRACSYIDEVVVGPPKALFGRFKRLGVYDWNDVYGLAKNDIARDVMAFRFSKTERFARPISWTTLQAVLREHGTASQLQSPMAISEACFFDLYLRGARADAA